MANSIFTQIDVLNNIANSLGPVQKLITGAAYLIGCAFLFKAIFVLKIYGESRTMMSGSQNVKEPIAYLFVGAVFIYFPTMLSNMLFTTFGDGSVLEFASINGGSATLSLFDSSNPLGRPLAMLIQVVGLIAFVKGWVLIARSASQGQPPGGTGKGLMHVFGGILAINILATAEMLNNTLYGAG